MENKEKTERQSRVLYFDILNICGCICVVAMHSNYVVWEFSYARYWITSMLIEVSFFWAVPVFFMLSGATLMDYRDRYSTKDFFKKRLKRVGIPFLVWSVVGLWFYKLRGFPVESFTQALDLIVNCKSMDIYWFFPSIIAVYAGMPVISLIDKKKRIPIFIYVAIYTLIVQGILPILFGLMGISFNNTFNMPIAGCMIWAIAGYLFSHVDFSKKQRIFIYLLGAVGWLTRYIGCIVFSYKQGGIADIFNGYYKFPGIFLAVAVFIWFRYHSWEYLEENERIVKIIQLLSRASLGIYLVHRYFITIALHYLTRISPYSWEWRVFGTIGVYFASLFVVIILKRIPVLRKIVP